MAFPERIVCLTEETTETLYLLGEEHRIVGISGFTVRPKEARKSKPKVALFTDANVDEILDLQPDLVIGFSDIQADITKRLIQKGLNVWTFNQRSVQEIIDVIRIMSLLVDAKDRGEELLKKINRNLSIVRKNAGSLSKRPKVFFEEWPDPLISGIRWVSELIECAGGKEVFPDLSLQPMAKNRIIADQSIVISQNPDIIIGSWCGKMVKPEKIKARPGWDKISAVQNNDIYDVHSSIILQPGPAALLEGVNALQDIILNWANRSGN